MDPKELDNIIDAAKNKPTEASAVAVAEPVTETKDDPNETKNMPAITEPVGEKPESEVSEAVAATEQEKAVAELKEKEAKEAADAIKVAEEAAAEVKEASAKEAADREAAKYAQLGSHDSVSSSTAKNDKKVNVLEAGLKKIIGAFNTPQFDATMDEFKEVMDHLNEAVKTTTTRELEIRVLRVDGDFSRVRYEIEVHENRTGDDTKVREWCFIDIPWVTGWPMKITHHGRNRTREDATVSDSVELEAHFGSQFKIEDSLIVSLCLARQTKKELKL